MPPFASLVPALPWQIKNSESWSKIHQTQLNLHFFFSHFQWLLKSHFQIQTLLHLGHQLNALVMQGGMRKRQLAAARAMDNDYNNDIDIKMYIWLKIWKKNYVLNIFSLLIHKIHVSEWDMLTKRTNYVSNWVSWKYIKNYVLEYFLCYRYIKIHNEICVTGI